MALYLGNQKVAPTVNGGGVTPSGTYTITANGTYDVTNYASADVSVSGGGGGTTYRYPQLKGGNWYVQPDNTIIPMDFYQCTFGSTTFNQSTIVEFGNSVGMTQAGWTNTEIVLATSNTSVSPTSIGKDVKHISFSGFPNSNYVITFSGQNVFYELKNYLTSISIANMKNLVLSNGVFRDCTNLSEVDVSTIDSMPNSLALGGTAALGGAFRGCTSLQTLSFNSLKSTSFGNKTNQFTNMLSGVTGCTVHFPSNLQSVIGSWSSVTGGFGGTNTTVLFDLPATM